MKVRIRYQDHDGNNAEQVFNKALEVTAEQDGKKVQVLDPDGRLHIEWLE